MRRRRLDRSRIRAAGPRRQQPVYEGADLGARLLDAAARVYDKVGPPPLLIVGHLRGGRRDGGRAGRGGRVKRGRADV